MTRPCVTHHICDCQREKIERLERDLTDEQHRAALLHAESTSRFCQIEELVKAHEETKHALSVMDERIATEAANRADWQEQAETERKRADEAERRYKAARSVLAETSTDEENRLRGELTALRATCEAERRQNAATLLRCHTCGEPATCFGAYEGHKTAAFGCDTCCGHGNEDGWCFPATAEEIGKNFDSLQRCRDEAREEDVALAALKNSGVDTSCGACMEVAFSGATVAEHSCADGRAHVSAVFEAAKAYIAIPDGSPAHVFCERERLLGNAVRAALTAPLPPAPAPAKPAGCEACAAVERMIADLVDECPVDFDGLEKVCEAATPGPWTVVNDSDVTDPDYGRVVEWPWKLLAPDGKVVAEFEDVSDEDAAHMAEARTAFPQTLFVASMLTKYARADEAGKADIRAFHLSAGPAKAREAGRAEREGGGE